MGRTVAGVVAGFVVAIVVLLAVETAGHMLFPVESHATAFDVSDEAKRAAAQAWQEAQTATFMERVPPGAKVAVLVGWFLAALAGGWVADRIGRRGLAGYIVAALIVAGGVWTMIELPHPLWMQAGGVLLPIAGAFFAERLARRHYRPSMNPLAAGPLRRH